MNPKLKATAIYGGILVFSVALLATRAAKSAEPQLIDVPVFRSGEAGTTYGDVMSHASVLSLGNDRNTNAHETCHQINNYVRNSQTAKYSRRINGFYCFDGKAMAVEEPDIQIRQIDEFVPVKLRGMRWKTYVNPGNSNHPGGSLYIYDEWAAYIVGAAISVDDFRRGGGYGTGNGTRSDDCDMSVTEFSFYGIGLAMACDKYDPEYWRNNQQFRAVTKAMLDQSGRICKAAAGTQLHWPNQDNYILTFKTDPSCEAMRKFVNKNFKGVWLQ